MTETLTYKDTKLLAFYLPQFHPIPENDTWWGKGFTEWMKVTRGRPLFNDHYQPHLPADLGFYDLRVPEVREEQAELARQAGISGFIYYHYWFQGRRLLERPFDEVLHSNKPSFPFCLCWANESWSRNWDGEGKSVLVAQSYNAEDNLAHIQWLLSAFADERYIKIDGRPLLFVYRLSDLLDPKATAALWRRKAQEAGWPDLYLCAVQSFVSDFRDPAEFGFDAAGEFKPNGTDCDPPIKSDDPLEIGYHLHRVWDYEKLVEVSQVTPLPRYQFFPGICPSWDNSVRRREGGGIYRGSTPEKYGRWLESILRREQVRPQKESIVLINAWNEWAEGNHLEPCQRWGHGYLHATRQAVDAARRYGASFADLQRGNPITLDPSYSVNSHLDSHSHTSTELAASGWCIDVDSLEPADLLLFARRLGEDKYQPLDGIVEQFLPRPDVSAHTDDPSSLLCGWRGYLPLGSGVYSAGKIHLIAVRLRDGAAAIVASI